LESVVKAKLSKFAAPKGAVFLSVTHWAVAAWPHKAHEQCRARQPRCEGKLLVVPGKRPCSVTPKARIIGWRRLPKKREVSHAEGCAHQPWNNGLFVLMGKKIMKKIILPPFPYTL